MVNYPHLKVVASTNGVMVWILVNYPHLKVGAS